MGTKSAAYITWVGSNVHPDEIIHIYVVLFNKSLPLRVDVDVLSIFYQKYNEKWQTYDSSLRSVASQMHVLASYGFHVTGVMDGSSRPDCKRDSWDRVKNKILSHWLILENLKQRS